MSRRGHQPVSPSLAVLQCRTRSALPPANFVHTFASSMSHRQYQAYFDTSGSASNSEVLTTAALVSNVSSWRRADEEWLAVLRRHGIPRFHMRAFVHWKGPFGKWIDPFTAQRDEAARFAFFSELVDVIESPRDCRRLHTLRGWSHE